MAIGDSVMLGAKSQLKAAGVRKVDAAVSRQASVGPGLVRERGAALPEHVVVHLGTNGTYTLKMSAGSCARPDQHEPCTW